ncbi:MAG TPA: hypothetical protein VK528_10830 [Flavobacterium sp.]|nr:hypothetical protein [Flavobacterium sp.]
MKDFKLDNHEKISPGFKIPEGYFDSLSEKITGQLSKEKPKVIPLYQKRKTWIYAAAAVLVTALSLPVYNSITANSNEPDQATLENYLANQSNISEDVLVDLLEKEDIEKLEIDYNLGDKAIEDALLHNANLEQYIIN